MEPGGGPRKNIPPERHAPPFFHGRQDDRFFVELLRPADVGARRKPLSCNRPALSLFSRPRAVQRSELLIFSCFIHCGNGPADAPLPCDPSFPTPRVKEGGCVSAFDAVRRTCAWPV